MEAGEGRRGRRRRAAADSRSRASPSGGRGGGGGGGGGGSCGGGNIKKSDAKCAAGVIENVCMLEAPVGASSARWERVARMVHGRIVNGYSESDIILGLVFRAKSLSLSVSGIQTVRPCHVCVCVCVCVSIGRATRLTNEEESVCVCVFSYLASTALTG